MGSPIGRDQNLTTLISPGSDGEASVFQLNTSDLAALRREYAKDTKDFQIIPYGPQLTPSATLDPLTEQEGIVTPDMFDAVLNAAQFDLEMNFPNSIGRVHGFSLYTPYKELERDTKVSAALQTRIMNSVERPWEITPASQDAADVAAADMVREQLAAMETHTPEIGETALLDSASGFDQVQAQFMDALLMGFATGEVLWDKDGGGMVYPREIKPKPQHRWAVYLSQNGWEPRLLTRQDRTLGVAVPARKFLFYRHRPHAGPFGRGLGHELYFPLSYKRRTLELFLIHAQRYASPTVFLELPPNVGEDVAEAARDAASDVGTEAAITIGSGTKVIPFEGKVGNNSTYDKLISYLDGQVSQVILGQTGTLDQDTGGGSRAEDEVADLQTLRLAKQDSDAFCAYVGRTLISWIVNENMPGARAPKLSRPFPELEESENAKEMAERDKLVVEFTGRRLTREFVEGRHGVVLEDELIQSGGQNVSSSPADLDSPAPAAEADTNLAEQGGGDAAILPGKSRALNLVPHTCQPVNLASTPIGEEAEWAEVALENLKPALSSFTNAMRAIVDRSRSAEEFERSSMQLLTSPIIRREMARAIAPALSVAYGIGQIDVEEELQDGEAEDSGVLFAEGINPVMGFDAAIEAVGSAVPIPTERWDSLQGSDQAWAFTVAGVMQADALTDIQAAVKSFIGEGGEYKDFKASFDDAIARTGLGALAPWRARLVLNQNVSNAYQAGRYARQQDPEYQRVAPYREYAHGFSDKPRAAHVALDGFVARIDDPIWATIFPPNGFNCSCRVFTLTQGQFDRGNYSLSDPLPSAEGDSPAVRLPNGEVLPIASEGFGQAPVAARTRKDALALAKERLSPDMWEALGIDEEEATTFDDGTEDLSGLLDDEQTETEDTGDDFGGLLDDEEDTGDAFDELFGGGGDEADGEGVGDLFGDDGEEDTLPDEAFARENFTLIGEGIEGRVYSDGGLAYKYVNKVTGDQAEFVENQRREALDNIRAVGDLGVGPKVYTISNDASVYTMDLLAGYDEGISPFDIGSKEERPYVEQLFGHLRTLEADGRAPMDIKEDNIMHNRETGRLLLIDQGATRKASAEDRAKLYFDRVGSRPLAYDTITSYVESHGTKANIKALKKLQEKYDREVLSPDPFSPAPKPKTEKQHKEFIDNLFKIVGEVEAAGQAPAKKKPAAKKPKEITTKRKGPLSKVSDADLIKNYVKGNDTVIDNSKERAATLAQFRAGTLDGAKMIEIVERLDKETKDSRNSYRREIIARLQERAADAIPELRTDHGMAEAELHRSVRFGGIEFSATDFSETSPAARTVAALAQDGWVPVELAKYTEKIIFTEQRNKEDAYWEKKYNTKDFVSAATGGDGNVVIYNSRGGDRALLSHEMGHNMATARYGITSPPPSSDFYAAAQKKGAPTTYGENSIAEDFAESVYLYVEYLNKEPIGKKFKKIYPERFEIIKNLLKKGSTYSG
jgi:phage gp29-like protein